MRTLILLFVWATLAHAQIVTSPGTITLGRSGLRVGYISVLDINGAHVKFKYAGFRPLGTTPDFLIVIPSSGTTPASVQVGLNPNVVPYFKPGVPYGMLLNFTAVDEVPTPGPRPSTGPDVTYIGPAEPAPNIQAVLNSASLQPSLSPGAQVSVLGSHLTGPTLSTAYDNTASYPTSVAGTSVTFNGITAPLLRLSPGKIRAIVPFAVAGQASVQVVVQRYDQRSDPFTLPLQDTAPGIFTRKHGVTGAGPILQQSSDGQFRRNSPDNPAAAGTKLRIFATGAGVWIPPPQSDVFIYGGPFTTQPVSLTIGGQPATITFAGTAGTYNTWSVLQVNAIMPDGLSSGPQPIVLTIGASDNSEQQATIWSQ